MQYPNPIHLSPMRKIHALHWQNDVPVEERRDAAVAAVAAGEVLREVEDELPAERLVAVHVAHVLEHGLREGPLAHPGAYLGEKESGGGREGEKRRMPRCSNTP